MNKQYNFTARLSEKVNVSFKSSAATFDLAYAELKTLFPTAELTYFSLNDDYDDIPF